MEHSRYSIPETILKRLIKNDLNSGDSLAGGLFKPDPGLSWGFEMVSAPHFIFATRSVYRQIAEWRMKLKYSVLFGLFSAVILPLATGLAQQATAEEKRELPGIAKPINQPPARLVAEPPLAEQLAREVWLSSSSARKI